MTPPMMMNDCTPMSSGEPGGEEPLEGHLGAQRDAQAGADHQQEGEEDGGGAEQAELLADGGEDEVGLGQRDAVGAAEVEAGAGDAAGREGELGLDDLEAVALRVRPRVEPDRRRGPATWANWL